MQWQREVEHGREEKLELEASFRRLDQEIGNGYHLAERKEKELRIAELVTKNQKMSQLLEKELQTHEEIRRAHADQQSEYKKLKEQVTLLNQVLDTVEGKNADLSSSHTTLTASYEAAQTTIETLQQEVHVLQDKLTTSNTHVQIVAEYEDKLQQWERTCRELERKCDSKVQKLTRTQQIASAAQQEAQRALHRQEELEQEVRNAHDQLIQTNATIRTMEAKLEANLKAAQHGGSHESLHRRIRHLEGELLQKDQANTDLMQTCNQLLGSQKRTGTSKVSLSTRNNHAMASRVAKLTTRIASLTDKLRSTEESRIFLNLNHISDQKGRSLGVLMQAFPFLLHRLDALQDQLTAAVESNDILKSALEQMQDPPNSVSNWIKPTGVHSEASYGGPCVSGSMYLHLAREKFLLEAPYPVEQLADLTGAQALTGKSESTTSLPGAKKKRFSPFRVTSSAMKLRDNQHEEESEDQTHQLVMLSADTNDVSGASYLNRSKINAFLGVIQSSAARKKFKTLVIGKLAECLNKLRELAHRSATEAAAQNASIQMLQREVVGLQQQLKNYPIENQDIRDGAAPTTAKASQDVGKMRHFLLKVVDVYSEKQQERDQRQMTFLTQPLSSDMLITEARPNHSENNGTLDDRLCLADSGLNDDDVAQLLLKVLIILDSNNLSDVGAQHVADFLEKAPTSVRVRVKEDDSELDNGVAMYGLALQRDFDVTGNATEILRVVLPTPSMNEAVEIDVKTTTTEAVDAMTDKLRQLGFRSTERDSSSTFLSCFFDQLFQKSFRS
uniref:Uncharacterized protein n=1 Tax=Phytophthora ramorum TaxID=164328 RepID=H3GEA1_PHYRM